MARPINTGGRHRRHTSIHPDREVGSSGGTFTGNNSSSHTKEISLSDHIIFAYEQLSETGFATREFGR